MIPTTFSYDCRLLGGVRDEVARSEVPSVPCGNGLDLIAFGNTIVKLGQRERRQKEQVSMVLNGVCLCASLLT